MSRVSAPAHQIFSLTNSDRQRLVLGVMLIPLAASCVLVSGICLARASQASNQQEPVRTGDVRVLALERERRADRVEFVLEDDIPDPGDAGQTLDSPSDHALKIALPAAQAGHAVPGELADPAHELSSDPSLWSITPRGPPSWRKMG